ncbi:hypothetical protein CSB11_00890 [Candidatus Campbellbacteria bacterium]|nr:MAG: hypothetical protein CSB11_00890 [Candidatus Campbellbacteria bacterium]
MENKNSKKIIRLVLILVSIILVGFLIVTLTPENMKNKVTKTIKKGGSEIMEKTHNKKDNKEDNEKETNISGKYMWLGTDLLDTKGGVEKPILNDQNQNMYIAHFENGSFSSSTMCNTLMGSYILKDSELTFSPLASTMMACEDDVMNQEMKYSEYLQKVSKFEKVDNYLYLSDKENTFKMNFKFMSKE